MAYHARMVVDERLHLPDLLIEGFRGIESLTLPRLGRVTLLTGKNGVGKSTVLEAVRAYTTQERLQPFLDEMLIKRREFSVATAPDGRKVVIHDYHALFHGRSASEEEHFTIGSTNSDDRIIVEPVQPDEVPDYKSIKGFLNLENDPFLTLKCEFGKDFPRVKSILLGSGILDDDEIAILRDKVALSDAEKKAVGYLEGIFTIKIDGIATTGGDQRDRRVLIKLHSDDEPIPLRSLGDGAVRLFGLALALANSRDGFLLIDEAENGIHHSIQRDYWWMVLQAAHDNNVQVIATTHSWDCVRGFAQDAVANEDVEGLLVRLEKDDDGIYPVEYSEDDLKVCAEQGIEVR